MSLEFVGGFNLVARRSRLPRSSTGLYRCYQSRNHTRPLKFVFPMRALVSSLFFSLWVASSWLFFLFSRALKLPDSLPLHVSSSFTKKAVVYKYSNMCKFRFIWSQNSAHFFACLWRVERLYPRKWLLPIPLNDSEGVLVYFGGALVRLRLPRIHNTRKYINNLHSRRRRPCLKLKNMNDLKWFIRE